MDIESKQPGKLQILVFILLAMHLQSVNAQVYKLKDHWYLGPKIGIASFYGDLSVNDFNLAKKLSDESGFTWAIMGGKSVSKLFDLRLNYLNGSMKGSNLPLNMFFNTHFSEFSFGVILNINKLVFRKKNYRLRLTGNFGAGSILFRSIKYKMSDGSFLSSQGYTPQKEPSGPAKSSIVFPIGIGADYRLTNRLKLSGEFSYRLMNSDLLDSQFGITGINDRYSYLSIGMFYILSPVKIVSSDAYECPVW